MDHIPPFNSRELEAVARILGDTASGLTGSEIGYILRDCNVRDVNADMTKWKRLFNALAESQRVEQRGNRVIMFITRAMDPVKYTDSPAVFESRQAALNRVLAFRGMKFGNDGKFYRVPVATDLADALERANRLHAALVSRKVHADVLASCRPEFLQQNYFHAVLEAMKSIAAKIRNLSGLTGDGAELVQQAFGTAGGKQPLLAINALATETDKGEQRGFANLLIGLFGTIRNPTAHAPKVEWEMSEQDGLDILTVASLVHRKLDRARRRCDGEAGPPGHA
jgi:uncharacterized protein (TIGR02391 family)